ncbi:MAG TPA: hypothetical protein PKE29_00595 [Phycisphaerales bacterium]|nr:hypothetical protein [Phycisphaerales bacterium]
MPIHARSTARTLIVLLLALGALFAPACSRRAARYSQATPDDTIQSAVAMIKNGDTERLTDLMYADGPEMRSVLKRLGKLLASMQRLSVSTARRFPAEFQELQDQAAKAAEDPKNKSLVGQIFVGMNGFDPSASKSRQPNADDVRNAFSAVLADPYGWLERNAARLTTVKTADDAASVMFDGEPAIPVVGLPMRLENGKWYIALPLNMPPMNQVMPRTRQQWSILGSTIRCIDNAVIDLTSDVDKGNVRDLKNLTDTFQDKVLFPVGIAFVAYMKELDVRGRTDRRVGGFKARMRSWVDARRKAAAAEPVEGDKPPIAVSPRLIDALLIVAPDRIEQIVRQNQPFSPDKLTDADFEELAGAWLADSGLRVRFDADLSPQSVDAPIGAWQVERKKKADAKPAPPKKK